MGVCTSSNNEIRSVVENFHLFNDKQFINFLETKICLSFEGGVKKKDYSKLNEPINMFSDTILHYAVFHNKQELCRYLLTHGADHTKLNKRKKTPIDIARSKNMTQLVNMFESK